MPHAYPLDDTPSLYQQQAPLDAPSVSPLDVETDLLLPPERTTERLGHFSEQVYTLEAESHLVRVMRVLLGDAGSGGVRKRFLAAHLQSTLAGSHFYDLDRFYGALFGIRRFSLERLVRDPYLAQATAPQWRGEHAKDSSYRSRIEQFGRAIGWGATAIGMELAAEAVLAVDCDVYENWRLDDFAMVTWADLERRGTYADLEGPTYTELGNYTYTELEIWTYAELESSSYAGNQGASYVRNEFTIRPTKTITQEHALNVKRVLAKLAPANTRFTVDAAGVSISTPVTIRSAAASSEHWEIVTLVTPAPEMANLYPVQGQAQEVPQTVFNGSQGAAVSHNGAIVQPVCYGEKPNGDWDEFKPVESATTVLIPGLNIAGIALRAAADAFQLVQKILAGRLVSDGILTAGLYSATRVGTPVPR